MGKSDTVRCASCHRFIDRESQFCKYCGFQVKRLQRREVRCPRCKKLLEGFSSYCPHCSYNLHSRKRINTVNILKYFVSVLIVILVLVIFFTILYKQEERRAVETEQPSTTASFLDIRSLQCEEKGGGFEICGTFQWNGLDGDYVIVQTPGATQAERQFTEETFDYCTLIGGVSGLRTVRMVLHNREGEIVDEVGREVACKKTVAPVQPVVSRREISSASKHGQFRAYQTTTYNRGSGTETITFTGPVESCTYDGTYVVDDKSILRTAGRCHNAGGAFRGYADGHNQYVTSDPGLFAWDYKVKQDPEPSTVEGFFFSVQACDISYYQQREPNNFVRARMSGFGTNILAVDWEFDDDAPDRAVEVLFTLICKVRSP